MKLKSLLSVIVVISALAVAGSASAGREPPSPLPSEPPREDPIPPKAICACNDLNVRIKSVGYEEMVQTRLNVNARYRDRFIVKKYRIKVGWKLTCTQGDPSACEGTFRFLNPSPSPGPGAAFGLSATKTVTCKSRDCKGNAGTYEMILGIRLDYLKAHRRFLVDLPVEIKCADKTSIRTLQLGFANGKFDRSASDFDGDGKAD